MNRIGDVAVWPAIAPNTNDLPYEIRLRGWSLWLTVGVYGLLAIGCLAGAVALWLASASSGPANPWLCVGLGLLGVLFASPVYFCFKPSIVLYPDRIEKMGLSGPQILYRTAIEGIEAAGDEDKFVRLKSASPDTKSIRLHSRALSVPVFAKWLEGMRDLTAEAFEASQAEVLADPQFGATETERARRLGLTTRLVQVASYLSYGIYLWVMVYPHPYRWAIGAAALMPLLATGLVLSSRGMVVWSNEKATARPNVVGVIWGATGALALRAFLDLDLLDWPSLVAVSFAIGIAVAWMLAPKQETAGRTLLSVLVIAVLPAAYVYGAAAQLNVMFDSSPGEVFRLGVHDHHESTGRNPTYELSVGPWGGRPAGTLSITRDLYRQVPVGSTVCVYRHAGLLKIRWFYVDHCADWKAP